MEAERRKQDRRHKDRRTMGRRKGRLCPVGLAGMVRVFERMVGAEHHVIVEGVGE